MIKICGARYIHIFLLMVGLSFKMPAAALTLYVSPQGSDYNPGTVKQPLSSLTGAKDRIRQLRNGGLLKDSVVIIIQPGIYYMQEPLVLTEADGGSSTFPVIFRAAKPGTAIFYGGKVIKGFRKNGGIWQAVIPETNQYGWTFEQLYIYGSRAQRAKFPNEGFYRLKKVTETILNKGTSAEITIQKLSLDPAQAALFKTWPKEVWEKAVVTFYHKWNSSRRQNLRFSEADTAIYMTSGHIQSTNKVDAQTLYTIENLPQALDAPGEWWLDTAGQLQYIPRPGEKIETVTVMAPVSNQFLIISGKENQRIEHVRFEGIIFKVAGYKLPVNGDEPEQAAFSAEATVMVDYAKNIDFINCEISQTGIYAIWYGKNCTDSKVEHCYLHDLGAGGVKIGEVKRTDDAGLNTHHIMVNNSIIRSGGHVFPCAVGVLIFHASDNSITHNEIADFRYTGISVGWTWNYNESLAKRNKIMLNHIHHLGWGLLSDMGAVYTLGRSEGTTVSNNVIHHVYASTYGGWGLYTDEGSTGIAMENNLVYACKSGAFHQHYGNANIIRNNIFSGQLHSQLEATRIEDHAGFYFTRNIVWYKQGNLAGIRWEKVNAVIDSNAYWDTRTTSIRIAGMSFNDWQKTGHDTRSIIADPHFADADNFDFRLTPASRTVMDAIRFIPFDFSSAGVYGDAVWLHLAQFDKKIADNFEKVVRDWEMKDLK